ncbi:hypothetical protein SAMN05421820_10369 [Pedobacter steynii]|uniref:T9SS C-terminal target domain-containing protein n=1 Tax=Pedobacter steynii TaxID=430522 RepID=A0A1G9QZR2_9SPHI|nr:hypothetical protein [Pedobacter steynii]NQX37929.1 hypothetical protein [Pedobacter steynii]SDM16508.1 hypothetical protein SAMN05421820_10369 [Pedobacter steynii]
MKIQIVNILLFSSLAICFSCKKEVASQANNGFEKRNLKASYAAATLLPVQTVSGSITTNTTWDNSKVWEISGVVVVKNGATLTIEPGTYIKSTVNLSALPNGALIIQKGSKISAVGTAENPIVFTSRYLLGDASRAPSPGDFGGIALLGNGYVNTGTKTLPGLPMGGFDFGGNNAAENSGSIRYVRIEYSGYILSTDNALNGLTCAGIGSGTTLDHIEISYSKADSFAFFGGSVNGSYLISKGADDDNFDFNNGYNGFIEYAVAVADKNSTHSQSGGSSDSHGIESDNNSPAEDATYSLVPKTHPMFYNLTIVGTSSNNSGYKFAIRNRRGAEIELYDSIITGYPSGLVFNDGTGVFYTTGISVLERNDFHGFTAAVTPAGTYPGNTQSTASAAPQFSMDQPFFNDGALDFSGATNGAFNAGNWTTGWSTL